MNATCLTPILDLAIQLDEALASAEKAARPDAATLAAVTRITVVTRGEGTNQ